MDPTTSITKRIEAAQQGILAAAERAGFRLSPHPSGTDLTAGPIPIRFETVMSGYTRTGRFVIIVGNRPEVRRFQERKIGFDFDEIVREIARQVAVTGARTTEIAQAERRLTELHAIVEKCQHRARDAGGALVASYKRDYYPENLIVHGLTLTFEKLTQERLEAILAALKV